MARPPKEINWDLVEKLMEAGCSGTEIAGKFRIQSDTLYIRFKKEYGLNFQDYHPGVREAGIADIKAVLHAKAVQGNPAILMFLGKTRAGLREPDTVHDEAANQQQIDYAHENMMLRNELAELKKQLEENLNE